MRKETDSISETTAKLIPWHVLGAGAIGSLFAWHMAAAGMEPVLIHRSPPKYPVSIQFQPFPEQLHSQTAQRFLQSRPFRVDDGAAPIQRLLVTVKAHQTEAALNSVSNRINPDTLIVLLQNGMGTWDIVRRLFPANPCLIATTTEGAYRTADKKIIHAGKGVTWIGALEHHLRNKAISLTQEWKTLGLDLEYDPNIMRRLWHKLAINCAINPLTVVYDCNNGKLLEIPEALQMMQALCGEVEIVMAAALGLPLSVSEPDHLFELVCAVAAKTGTNISSMLQDVRAGRDTELEFITGYLVREAERLCLSVPSNQSLLTRLTNV